jgi:hypothetical protein
MTKRVSVDKLLSLLPQDEQTMSIAKEILSGCYETTARHVNVGDNTTKYGYVFPIQPEILYDLMVECKDKVVLELAAASGDNAILIGLAGAKEVHINDNAIPEMKTCMSRISKLPKELRERFKLNGGDCFKMFEDESYSRKFDVIYARNFYHFFLGEKKTILNKLLHRLLKGPDGKLVLSTNSVNTTLRENGVDMAKTHPDSYVFDHMQPILRSSLNKGNDRITKPTIKPLSPADGEKRDPLKYNFRPIMCIKDGQILATDTLADLDASSIKEVTSFMSGLLTANGVYVRGDEMRQMDLVKDVIEVHICTSVMYSRRTLPKQFSGSGLIAYMQISTDIKGHTTEDSREETSLTVFCRKM